MFPYDIALSSIGRGIIGMTASLIANSVHSMNTNPGVQLGQLININSSYVNSNSEKFY